MNSKLESVHPGTMAKLLKLRDVRNLLTKHFGPNWDTDKRLIFYKNILASVAQQGGNRNDGEEDMDEEDPWMNHRDEMCETVEDVATSV